MNLVIDGSFEKINLSIFKDRELVYDLFIISSQTHSKILVNIFDFSLNSLGCSIEDIKNVYVCVGPGRYTSLRVVLSTIKGIFFERLKYVYTVNRLDLMATNLHCVSSESFSVVCEISPSIVYRANYVKKDGMVSRIGDIERIDENNFQAQMQKGSLTKNIFLINPKHIEKKEIEKLTPIY